MTQDQIKDALLGRLRSTPGAPQILEENQGKFWNGTEWQDPVAPYWMPYEVRTPPERLGVSETHILIGRLVVAVMVDENTGTVAMEQMSQAIIDQFPTDLTLTAGDGFVQVSARTYADDAFQDGTYWRCNVHVRWRTLDR